MRSVTAAAVTGDTIEAVTDTDSGGANAALQLRRSSRNTRTTECAGSPTLPQPPQVPNQPPSGPTVNTSLLQNLPQDIVASYRAVIDTAHLDEEWHACISQWLLVESQNKQVGLGRRMLIATIPCSTFS